MKIDRKSLWRFMPALAVFFVHPLVAPRIACAESLDDAVKATLSSHPSLESARQDSESAAQDKREARSDYFPTLALSATGGRIYGDNATSRGLSVTRGAGYSNLTDKSVSAREKIFTGFQTTSRIESAENKKASADLALADTEDTLTYKTAQAYLELMRTRDGLKMLTEYGHKVDDYAGRIKKMLEGGAADETTQQQARDIRVILDGLISDYKGQERAAESNYFDLTGHVADATLTKPTPRADLIPPDVNEALAYAKDHHPQLQAAAYGARSAEADVKAEKGTLYPEVEAELSYLKEGKQEIIGGDLTDERAVMHVNWNLETGGAELARIAKKKAAHAQALAQAEEARKRVELGVRLAWSEYETARAQTDNQDKRRALNEKLFEAYKAQFEGSKITLIQLMQAENQLFTTGLEQLNGRYRLLGSEYGVLASLGRMREGLQLASAETVPAQAVKAEPAAGQSAPPSLPAQSPSTAKDFPRMTGFDD